MTPVVMTVLGPVEASALGVTLPHEHILCDLWRVTRDPRHFMVDGPLAVEEVGRFKAAGGGAIVDCTTRQFGRDPLGLRAVARATGVHVVMGCGSQAVYMKPLLVAYGGTGYGYILTDFVPRLLAAGLSREQVEILPVDNPRRALTGERATAER